MSDIELKPCPKCGSTSVKYFEYLDDKYNVFCKHCGFETYYLHEAKEQAAEAWNALPRHLRWTTETPTEPDFYWHRDDGVLSIAYIYESAGTLFCHFAGEEDATLLDLVTGEWAGPIPEPEEPE